VNRQQLEHVIQAIGTRFSIDYFYVIGSSAILAAADAPAESVVITRDVDVIPNIDSPEALQKKADQIDFVMGECSDFDEEFGYYAQGVDFSTPTYAPPGWQGRLRQDTCRSN